MEWNRISFLLRAPTVASFMKTNFLFPFRNIDEDKMQKVCSIIAEWFTSCDEGSSFLLSDFGNNFNITLL